MTRCLLSSGESPPSGSYHSIFLSFPPNQDLIKQRCHSAQALPYLCLSHQSEMCLASHSVFPTSDHERRLRSGASAVPAASPLVSHGGYFVCNSTCLRGCKKIKCSMNKALRTVCGVQLASTGSLNHYIVITSCLLNLASQESLTFRVISILFKMWRGGNTLLISLLI